jgi:hypothetical protein
LSFPVSPAQAVLSKLAAFGVASGSLVLALHGAWCSAIPRADASGDLASQLRASADMWLLTFLLWGALLFCRQVGRWVVVAPVVALLIASQSAPPWLTPMSLMLPIEAAGHSLLWPRAIAAALTASAVLILERTIALTPVE